MSHANANFRNTAGDKNYGLRFDPGRMRVDAMPGMGYLPPFLDLACGQTTEGDLLQVWYYSFYRTSSIVENRRFYARECRLRLDNPGPVEITVTATGFTPYITLVRNSNNRWTSSNGVIVADISADQTGPFTLEVTSLEPYRTGHFEVHVSCIACEPLWQFNLDETAADNYVGFNPAYYKSVTQSLSKQKGQAHQIKLRAKELNTYVHAAVYIPCTVESVVSGPGNTCVVTVAGRNWTTDVFKTDYDTPVNGSYFSNLPIIWFRTGNVAEYYYGVTTNSTNTLTLDYDDSEWIQPGDEFVIVIQHQEHDYYPVDVNNHDIILKFAYPETENYILEIIGSYRNSSLGGYNYEIEFDCSPVWIIEPNINFRTFNLGGRFPFGSTNPTTVYRKAVWSGTSTAYYYEDPDYPLIPPVPGEDAPISTIPYVKSGSFEFNTRGKISDFLVNGDAILPWQYNPRADFLPDAWVGIEPYGDLAYVSWVQDTTLTCHVTPAFWQDDFNPYSFWYVTYEGTMTLSDPWTDEEFIQDAGAGTTLTNYDELITTWTNRRWRWDYNNVTGTFGIVEFDYSVGDFTLNFFGLVTGRTYTIKYDITDAVDVVTEHTTTFIAASSTDAVTITMPTPTAAGQYFEASNIRLE